MKTNKFENTIRRKLESIEPDFQEQDWARMQSYMQAHTPPTFLQQYGSWIGYAAAASVTSVMAFLYVNQLSQNDHLVTDMQKLQSQIEVIKNQPAPVAKTDTVYILQQMPDGGNYAARPSSGSRYGARQANPTLESPSFDNPTVETRGEIVANATGESPKDVSGIATNPSENAGHPERSGDLSGTTESVRGNSSAIVRRNGDTQSTYGFSNAASGNFRAGGDAPIANAPGNHVASASVRAFDDNFQVTEISNVTEMNAGHSLKRRMNYELAGRLSNRQVQKALLANHMQVAKAPVATKKAEQVAQAENVIPKLNLKVPYRFGGGYQFEGNGQAKTIQGEVIVNKKFSIAAGITWLKVKPAEFFSEKIFREKNSRDFKATHPGEVPLIFDLYNIKIAQTVVQMPLTLAFRNNIKNDWAYYASMGANVKLSSKETISYDCRGPKNEFFNQTFSKKGEVPGVTSVNFAVGIEKSWHPIVVQTEAYWVNYFKPVTPFTRNAGPGLKVKLLYQIGRQM